MKKNYFFLCLVILLGISVQGIAQIDPGTTNLKHQWTFDEDVTDRVGGLAGTLEGAATLSNRALNTTAGGYFSMPGEQIGVNAYSALTVEIWFTSSAGVNTDYTMLSYFGNTSGIFGVDYHSISAARGDNVSKTAMSCLNSSDPWATESGANGPEYDDGLRHQMVSVVTDTDITLFIDGVSVATTALSESNKIANISTAKALLAAGGYTNDPTWRGNIHKFSIYNKALSSEEVLYLYQDGAEEQQVLLASTTSVALDTKYPADVFNVSGSNLTENVVITVPDGLYADPVNFVSSDEGKEVFVVWDTTTPVDGKIVITSGTNVVEIPVKTADDSECYNPLYTTVTNIVEDPGLNNLSFFAGWGARNISNIVNDPTNVYCGASSISVGNGTAISSGSLDVNLVGKIVKNTFYRVRAMVKTVDGTFQMGVGGHDVGGSDFNNIIDTQGEWQLVDFTFTTGDSLRPNNQPLFFNNYQCTGTIAYVDNWEMYETTEPILAINKTSEAFDPEWTMVKITVSGTNLNEDITITVPAGVTASPASLPTDSKNVEVNLIWDGATVVNGDVIVSSTGQTQTLSLKSTSNSNNGCYVPTYTDKTNLVPDPFFNDPTKFGGWGAKDFINLVSNPDSVYCGSHTGRLYGNGSIDVILTGIVQKNKSYLAKAMVMTVGGYFQMGVWGMDAFDTSDKQDSIDTQGSWMPITFQFVTGDSLTVTGQGQGMFFNKYQRTGQRALIDNWELYEIGGSSVITPMDGYSNVYVEANRIVAEFELIGASAVELSVYNLQGALVAHQSVVGDSGRNRKYLDGNLPSGMYLVKISSEGRQLIRKVIR